MAELVIEFATSDEKEITASHKSKKVMLRYFIRGDISSTAQKSIFTVIRSTFVMDKGGQNNVNTQQYI